MAPKKNRAGGKKPAKKSTSRDNRRTALNQRLSRAVRGLKEGSAYKAASEMEKEEMTARLRAAVTQNFEADYRPGNKGMEGGRGKGKGKTVAKTTDDDDDGDDEEMKEAEAKDEEDEEDDEDERDGWAGPKSNRPGLPPRRSRSRSPPPPPPPPTMEHRSMPPWLECIDPILRGEWPSV
ncbi:uncharacterized protein BP5553_10522 [Venustampulla echinocandica]|uniref:Uncharacterized protein n=1 Tax=Venustampulla echinocandica TaxID=2656787 RepID=A0A370T8T2_9HELO|nr:uncharacterized protein BP5553_10522 [Venustampulla echinocandica]RDL29895.1 hypothetical protein BP5553_10522 [Venustampulla echinocandica]